MNRFWLKCRGEFERIQHLFGGILAGCVAFVIGDSLIPDEISTLSLVTLLVGLIVSGIVGLMFLSLMLANRQRPGERDIVRFMTEADKLHLMVEYLSSGVRWGFFLAIFSGIVYLAGVPDDGAKRQWAMAVWAGSAATVIVAYWRLVKLFVRMAQYELRS